ncbi:hypothetical protein B0T21DRAFT_345919 [Apiosordaria backusii]|uniref:Uncharacterized protein n=1 Tax=Apiosordaria backusii TaxID=314023 RepID=A0AA40EMI0_9PEZI|nr:hypothetical protein B0T21DRAFT_345919 [Apiosordaria backusii]
MVMPFNAIIVAIYYYYIINPVRRVIYIIIIEFNIIQKDLTIQLIYLLLLINIKSIFYSSFYRNINVFSFTIKLLTTLLLYFLNGIFIYYRQINGIGILFLIFIKSGRVIYFKKNIELFILNYYLQYKILISLYLNLSVFLSIRINRRLFLKEEMDSVIMIESQLKIFLIKVIVDIGYKRTSIISAIINFTVNSVIIKGVDSLKLKSNGIKIAVLRIELYRYCKMLGFKVVFLKGLYNLKLNLTV